MDFEEEMQKLAKEAESAGMQAAEVETATARSAAGGPSGREVITAIAQLIRPLAVSVSSIDQRTKDNAAQLEAVRQAVGEGGGPASGSTAKSSGEDGEQMLEKISHALREGIEPKLKNLESLLEQQKNKENSNQQLFDAMHKEMRDYKEIFLFEALQKPIIRDMLLLYDDLSAIEAQSRRFRKALARREQEGGVSAVDSETKEFFENQLMNLENLKHLFVEIFDRLQVTQIRTEPGPLDKQLQKVLKVVPTDKQDEDNLVERKLRPGFYWRDRVLRPEEVTVKRYQADSGESS